MKLLIPDKAEATVLLSAPPSFHNYVIVPDALPPAFILDRAREERSAHWLMPRLFCDEARGEIVGSGCFKSEPVDGTVEIGYGVSSLRRCRGYATAGLLRMPEEAFASNRVTTVCASSLSGNPASRRVLEKAGFWITGAGIDEDEGPVDLWINTKDKWEAGHPSRTNVITP